MREVAQRAGVSTATVSRALSGSATISDAVRERIMAAVQEVGYRPNAVARALRVTGTRTIGLVISDLLNPFFTELARAVEDEARANGYTCMIGNADERPDRLDHYVATLLERQVDGLLAVPTVDVPPLLRQAVDSGAPVVLIDREVPDLDAPVVRSDNGTAVADLVDHLVALGHERIAIIAGPQELTTGRERLDAFRTALSGHQVDLPAEYVRVGDFQEASGRTAMAALLDLPQPPSVVFAADNLMVLGALAVLRDRTLRVPEDVGLAAFDDVPWFPYLDPPVTAIAQEVVQMGRLAVRMLLDRINGRPVESVLLPSRLVVRASCGERGIGR